MSKIAVLRFAWDTADRLHTGYGYDMAVALGKIRKGERKSVNLETHSDLDTPEPALLASSVKGVFRSASAWLVERVAREQGAENFVTCDYHAAVPDKWRRRFPVPQTTEFCPVCRVYGGSGCLAEMHPSKEERPSRRRLSPTRFVFDEGNDAFYGQVRRGEPYTFAWQVVEGKGRDMEVEQLRAKPGVTTMLEVRIEPADDFAVSLVRLSADLVSSGFFRFGRFVSRGYGLVRLHEIEPPRMLSLDQLLSATAEPTLQTVEDDYHDIINRNVVDWLTNLR
jgi:CRISPR/Cas system CSM-associated protein Csm3 (group 7 of RAMP superfamily)